MTTGLFSGYGEKPTALNHLAHQEPERVKIMGQKGPMTNKPEKKCAGCDYLKFWCGMCNCWAECKHPDVIEKGDYKYIGRYERGNDRLVPTPKWCPMLN